MSTAKYKLSTASDFWIKDRLRAKKKYRTNARRDIEKLIGKIKGVERKVF